MQLLLNYLCLQIPLHFNLLFEANFYATFFKEFYQNITENNFNLLFEANFYATSKDKTLKEEFIEISIFFLKLISMQPYRIMLGFSY